MKGKPQMSARVKFWNVPCALHTEDEQTITVRNLRWFFEALRKGYVKRVVLTNCYCEDCMRARAHKRFPHHDFALCAFGKMPRGRNGKTYAFEYQTPYASLAVFNERCRKRIERHGVTIGENIFRTVAETQ